MQEKQYPELSEEELHELMNGPFAQEIIKSSENSMRYLHEQFLRKFYIEFPDFYNFILQNEDEAYLMEDLGDGELIAITITGTLLHYIEKLMNDKKIDEIKRILKYLEEYGYESEDLKVKDLVIGFVNDIYIVPDILHKLVKLLPPGMYKHFMEYNSDLLEE